MALDRLLHELEDAGRQGRPGARYLAPRPLRGLQEAGEVELRPADRLHPHCENSPATRASQLIQLPDEVVVTPTLHVRPVGAQPDGIQGQLEQTLESRPPLQSSLPGP